MYGPERRLEEKYPSPIPYYSHEYSGFFRSQDPYAYERTTPRHPKTKPNQKRLILTILIIIFAILNTVIISFTLFLDWYQFSYKIRFFEIEEESNLLFSFSEIKLETSRDSETISWDDSDMMNLEESKDLYNYTKIIVIIAIIFNILFLISGIILITNKFKILVVIFSILTLIFCILAPLYFGMMHTEAMKNDMGGSIDYGPGESFVGSHEESDLSMSASWGPSLGWYMAVIGAILSIISLGISLVVKVPWLGLSRAPSYQTYYQYSPADYYPPQSGYPPNSYNRYYK